MQPLEVTVRWETDGWVTPLEFRLGEVRYPIDSTGRSWRDEAGLHVLAMAGERAFELIFNPVDLTWSLGYQGNPQGWA
ncbi:MAG: hypothetical protein PHQ40_15410 [Anaerolineaceae bacterium]|nr:hypothetical protein [Anaerolineaceae bacterium]